MKTTKILSILFLTVFLASCGGGRKASQASKHQSNENPRIVINQGKIDTQKKPKRREITQIEFTNTEAYILYFRDVAIQKMKEFHIPASITLAQGVLESNSGKSELALKSNNHFGIKCHEWTGERVYHDDDEKGECFRKYGDPKQSYEDHSLFLTTRSRYAPLFKLKKRDYIGWAKGLKKAGYATDKNYPNKLIEIIEKYHLDRYDRKLRKKDYAEEDDDEDEKIGENSDEAKTEISLNTSKNTHGFHIVEKGETLYAISRKYGIDVETLKSLNNLSSNDLSIGQMLKVTADNNDMTAQSSETRYIVQQGDTLYAISRKTGVPVAKIKSINNLNSNELKIGQELILKK